MEKQDTCIAVFDRDPADRMIISYPPQPQIERFEITEKRVVIVDDGENINISSTPYHLQTHRAVYEREELQGENLHAYYYRRLY